MNRPRNIGGGGATPVAIPVHVEPTKAPWREALGVRQDAPGFHKRWFSHPSADLFAWTGADGAVVSLQFCWREGEAEHMVAWDHNRPAEGGRIDEGESSPLHNRSPVMVRGGVKDGAARNAWLQRRAGLPAELVRVVEDALGF